MMLKSTNFIKYICTLLLAISGTKVLSQGAAVVMPLSKVAQTVDETIVFFVHNRIDSELVLKYEPKCDIDGVETVGESCLAVFGVEWDSKIEPGKIVLAQGAKIKGEVKLKKKDLRFALYKPLFSPIVDAAKKKNSVTFDFGYQPGYLFIVKPLKERIDTIAFDTYVVKDTRHARMKVSIDKLTVPQVVSISAKFFEKDTKKLIRFARLASDKIIDPKRSVLELDSEFTEASNKANFCYQAFVEAKTAKDFYTIDTCK